MIDLGADVLAPGHTRPVFGAERVRDTLSAYRDAIRFVVEKTAEGMNLGLGLDDLISYVQLPPALAERPCLWEVYGTVEYAVRAFYAGTMGWFDGNPTNLRALSAKERARRLVALSGGDSGLLSAMRGAVRDGDYRWAMELADHLLALETNVKEARASKQAALRALATDEGNAPVRNYMYVYANEMDDEV